MLFSFMTRLLFNSIVIIILLSVILLIKNCFKKQLTARTRYQLWFIFLFILAVPFLPCSLICQGHTYKLFGLLNGSFPLKTLKPAAAAYKTAVSTRSFMQDFSVSVNRMTPPALPSVILGIWIFGMGFMALTSAYSNWKVRLFRESSLPLQNRQIRCLFTECREESGIRKEIPLYSSAYLDAPITAGLWNPYIIVPIRMLTELPKKDIRYILLHELQHYKHKDLLANQLMALAQIIYWFHPLVWFALKEMRSDREIACDSSVLSLLDPESYLDYGNTLIHFAEKLSRFSYSAAGISGSKKEIRKRIVNIAGYRRETRWHKMKSRIFFTSAAVLAFVTAPALSAGAFTGMNYDFSAKNVTLLDLESYFCGYNGSFVLFDVNRDQYCIYNEDACLKRISPDSTYKIYSALSALENGIITSDSNLLAWDGSPNPYEAWDHDQTLQSAMAHSVNWYFTALDEKNGLSSLKQDLDDIAYGNRNLSGGPGRYWIESSLKISPVEQAELLTRFCQGELPFQPDNIRTVKDSIFLSSSKGAALYGKTGTGTVNGKNVNGWFIGFVESEEDTFVFAANIQAKDSADGSTAGKIALKILRDKNIYVP